jgi:hypothetical protein
MFATDNGTRAKSYLRGDPISLVATNIPTFMGGRANPWLNSAQTEALDRRSDAVQIYKEQSFSDGYLELTSVETIVNLGLGITRRVGQADGEITLKFNEVMND